MISPAANRAINARLRTAYQTATDAFLTTWHECFQLTPPCRINEFGIIDENRYDRDNGILCVARETNDWSDEEYEAGCLFRPWMEEITHTGLAGRGKVRKHPNMWYNIGRWVTLLSSPSLSLQELAAKKADMLPAIGTIAFTNVNKVRGCEKSGDAYFRLARSAVARSLLHQEIEILSPKIVLCCGTYDTVLASLPDDFTGKLIEMPHPAARMGTLSLLQRLQAQLNNM